VDNLKPRLFSSNNRKQMIIGQALLQQIKQFIPDAVIAGGYVRDHVLGGKFKDIDVFIPVKNFQSFNLTLSKLKIDGLTKADVINQYKGYKTFYTSDFLFHNIPVQIIGHRITEGGFAERLLESFNYDIDKMYYDGTDTIISDVAEVDKKNKTCTLSSLKEMSYLTTALKKYERFKEKYPGYKFKCSGLEPTQRNKMVDIGKSVYDIEEVDDLRKAMGNVARLNQMENLWAPFNVVKLNNEQWGPK